MNGYSIWYWLLDKLGFGFFSNSPFLWQGIKNWASQLLFSNTPKSMEAKSRSGLRVLECLHLPPSFSASFLGPLALVRPAQLHEANVKELLLLNSVERPQRADETVGPSPLSLNVPDEDIGVQRSMAAQSHPGGELGWETKSVTFQPHNTVKPELWINEGPAWKGLGLSASSSLKEVPTCLSWWLVSNHALQGGVWEGTVSPSVPRAPGVWPSCVQQRLSEYFATGILEQYKQH